MSHLWLRIFAGEGHVPLEHLSWKFQRTGGDGRVCDPRLPRERPPHAPDLQGSRSFLTEASHISAAAY
eukprot:2194034-Alexandrium_andersonii.AAC.1